MRQEHFFAIVKAPKLDFELIYRISMEGGFLLLKGNVGYVRKDFFKM